jgi:hypothetical protein
VASRQIGGYTLRYCADGPSTPAAQVASCRSRPPSLRKLATDQDPGTLGANRFVVQFAFGDNKYLTRLERNRRVVLLHRESAHENQSPDVKKVAMTALPRARSQVLKLYFGVAVGSQLRLEVTRVHFAPGSLHEVPTMGGCFRNRRALASEFNAVASCGCVLQA